MLLLKGKVWKYRKSDEIELFDDALSVPHSGQRWQSFISLELQASLNIQMLTPCTQMHGSVYRHSESLPLIDISQREKARASFVQYKA